MSNRKISVLDVRLALFGNANRDKKTFELDFDTLSQTPGILRWALGVSKLIMTDCGIQSSDFVLIGKTVKNLFKEAYSTTKQFGAYKHLDTFNPSDLEFLFFMEGLKPPFYLKAIAKLQKNIPGFLPSHIPAYNALVKGVMFMNLWLDANCSTKFNSIESGLSSYLKYDWDGDDRSLVMFPDNPGFLYFFLEAMASCQVAIHGQAIRDNNDGNSDDSLKLVALLKEKRFLEANVKELKYKIEEKRIIASETGRQAVLEGKWNPRDKKFATLKPEIDKLAAQNKKHHEIAEKLIKREDENNNPLCSYKTSKGLQQEIKFGELKDLIKSYFIQTDREHLIHGRKKTC